MSVPMRLQRMPMLTWLREYLLSPDAGGVRVQGPTGIGKTHILFELHRQLRKEPGLLVGSCRFECLEEPPLFPVLGALGEAIGSWLDKTRNSIDYMVERLPPDLALLSRATARFAVALGSPTGTGEPGSRWRLREVADDHRLIESTLRDDPTLFLDTLTRLMVSLVRDSRLSQGGSRFVLIIDQLEQAGRRSRALVEMLLELPPSVCSLVVSLNEAANAPQMPLPPGLTSLPAVELESQSGEGLVELYERSGGQESWRLEPGRLHLETRGNPLSTKFLALAERFNQPFDANRPLASHHVRPLLSVLSAPARELLGLLALLPVPLYLGRLDWAELLRVDTSTVEPLIQSLVQQGVLGTYPRTLVFTHERYREVVLEDLQEEERTELGSRLAKFLEIQTGRDLERACVLPALSAFHVGIGLAGDLELWLRTGSELCEGWYALGEWEQARHYCEQLIDHHGRLPLLEQARLFNILGMIAYRQGRLEEATEAFEQAKGRADALDETGFTELIELNLAGVALARNDLAAARAIYTGWLQRTAAWTQPELVWQGWYQLGLTEARAGAVMEALTAFLKAIKGAEPAGAQLQAARIKQELAELLLAHGQLDSGLAWLKRAGESFDALNARSGRAHVLERMAMVYEMLEQPAMAECCWLDALACVQDDGHIEAVWCTIANNYSSFLHRSGRCDDAVRILQRALEVVRTAGRAAQEARILNNLAMLCEALGASQLALEHARNSLRIKRRLGDRRGGAVGANNLGTLLFALKQYDEAWREFQQSLDIWRSLDDAVGEAITLNNLAMLHERRGEYEKALRCYRSSLALKEMMKDPGAVRHTLANMVVFLDETRRFAKAEDCMRSLVALDRMTNHPDLTREEDYLTFLSERARDQLFIEP